MTVVPGLAPDVEAAASAPRNGGGVRWAALVAVTISTWIPILWLDARVGAPPPGAIEHADFTATGGDTAPPPQAAWSPVVLPDDWRDRVPHASEGWYRMGFQAPHAEALGVYVPSVATHVTVGVNGTRLAAHGPRPVTFADRNGNRPLLFDVPAGALGPDVNVLQLHVAADHADAGFLPVVYVAPLAELVPVYARATLIRRTLLWGLIIFRLTVAAFTAAIWAMWRKESYYGWFALCVAAWVVAEADLVIIDPPLPSAAWNWLFNVAIGWWGIFAVRLVLSFVGVSTPRAERALMTFGVAGSAALAALAFTGSPLFHPFGVNVWLATAFVLSCYLFRGVVSRLRDYPDAIELNVVFVVATSVIGCVFWDLLMQLGLRHRGGIAVPAYASFVTVLGMGWVLVRRFVGALARSRALVATLEERVAVEHARLEESYRRIRDVDRARVLSEERERILRDTDDGLGSQLVSTLALLDRASTSPAELRWSVRAALDDLRLVIDSLDPLDGDLLPALGMLRARLQPRLEAAGVRVVWAVASLPPLGMLTPHWVLQVLRILQRAFMDVVVRGVPCTMEVRTGTHAGPNGESIVVVGIGDDIGAIVLHETSRARAREIGVALDVARDASGSKLELSFPVAGSRVHGIATTTEAR